MSSRSGNATSIAKGARAERQARRPRVPAYIVTAAGNAAFLMAARRCAAVNISSQDGGEKILETGFIRNLERHCLQNATQRVIKYLLQTSAAQSSTQIKLDLKKNLVASLLNLAPSTLSRILH